MMTNLPPEGPTAAAGGGGMPPERLPVEWQLVEQIAGDPWSAELVVWSGEGIDGVVVPLDEELVNTVAEVRRHRLQLAGESPEPDQEFAGTGTSPTAEQPAEDQSDSRAGRLWRGLGRTTGSSQADRWLENIPVRWQVIAAVVLLALFAVMMLIGRLTA